MNNTLNKLSIKTYFEFTLLVSLLVLLVAPLGIDLSRREGILWDLGHFFAFFLISKLLLTQFNRNAENHLKLTLFLGFVLPVLIGIVVECTQYFIATRNFGLSDIALNTLGALCNTLLVLSIKFNVNALLKLFSVTVPLLSSYPIFHKRLQDEILIEQQFPILSEFQFASETNRWVGHFSIDCASPQAEQCALHHTISKNKYSGVTLKHLASDWRNYQELVIEFWADSPMVINVRISDWQHLDSNEYHDRFNLEHAAAKGWGKIRIPLNVISQAPQSRELNISNIHSIGFFSATPHTATEFKIAGLYLVKIDND